MNDFFSAIKTLVPTGARSHTMSRYRAALGQGRDQGLASVRRRPRGHASSASSREYRSYCQDDTRASMDPRAGPACGHGGWQASVGRAGPRARR